MYFTNLKIYENDQTVFANSEIYENGENIFMSFSFN